MTVLVDRRSGSEADALAYLIRVNVSNGNLEFYCKGSSGTYVNTLIERPYLDRWYHVAVVRQGEAFTGYVDGRQVFSGSGTVGNAGNTQGVSIGGWGGAKYFCGEIQEVAVYQAVLSQELIATYLFKDQPSGLDSLKGYFKLGYATNATDSLKNYAFVPVPEGTENGTKQGTIEFDETNQAGEQSAFDAQRNGGRDALTPLSGAFTWDQTAFARPTPGIAFDFRFGYSSANTFGGYKLGNFDPYGIGPMGKGWRHSFEVRVLPATTFAPLGDTDTLGLMLWNGALNTWDRDSSTGEYRPRNQEYSGELMLTPTNCQWITPERLVYIFTRPDTGGNAVMRGRLMAIRDFNGNRVSLHWNEITGVLTQAVDSAGGRYEFNMDARALLTNMTFGAWSVDFTYDATNRLAAKSITNTSGFYTNIHTSWTFSYNSTNGLLERITDPRINAAVQVAYDKYGRKVSVADALHRATVTEYAVPGRRQLRHTDPGGFKWIETYDRKGHILAQHDPLTNVTSYTYDEFGNRTSITEPLGWQTHFGYDERANVITRTNALGEVTRWTFHGFFNKATNEINPLGWTNHYELNDATGNLLRHYDALGTLVSYTYTTNGLPLTTTDGNGNVTRFAYDTNGFLIATTDPLAYTNARSVNEVGWTLATTNALGQLTTFAYDLNGKAVRTVDTLSRVYLRT